MLSPYTDEYTLSKENLEILSKELELGFILITRYEYQLEHDVDIIIDNRSIKEDNNIDLIVLYKYTDNIITIQKNNSYKIPIKSITTKLFKKHLKDKRKDLYNLLY